MRQPQSLEAQVIRLNAQLRGLKNQLHNAKSGVSLDQIPVWDVVRMNAGGGLTSGDDWDPLFDEESATDRIVHSLRTAGGELSHVNSDNCATRLRIRFTGQGDSALPMKLGIAGSGRVQIKANGEVSEYTSGAFISMTQVAPPLTNELIVMADGDGGALQVSVDALLFDGVNRHWVSY